MMHIGVVAALLAINWRQAAFAKWRNYHATILYIIICDLAYHYFCAQYPLWVYELQKPIGSRYATELLYTLMFLPLTALLYLACFPWEGTWKAKGRYMLGWIAAYATWEWLFLMLRGISHENGWSMSWSLLFYCEMFPMLALHSKRPRMAYALSVVCAGVWLVLFRVPLL
ncbi:CBO0543 family protein [Paenibacillus xanthanilyticus]|uniref:CBO0543 family protein n=1 Tax=Paenibacillus xanthanilyticus TaxID=1783531 RepID=A0ABV8JYY1_9BACL